MPGSYSADPRERVLVAVEAGESPETAAKRFMVGRSLGPSTGVGAGSGGVPDAPAGGPAHDHYLAALRRRLQAHLSYPEAARRLRPGGTVLIRFHIRADGSLDDASLVLPVAPAIACLGDGARRTVRQSAPFGPPPMGAMTIEVPIVFVMR